MDGWVGGVVDVGFWLLGEGGGGWRERRGRGEGEEGGEEPARCLWFFVGMFLVEVGFGAIPRGFCLRCGL